MDDKEKKGLKDLTARLDKTRKKNIKRINRYIKLAGSFPIPDMTRVIPEGTKGEAVIEHFEVPDDPVRTMRAMFSDPMHYIPAGKYVRLLVGGQIMMTNTLFERATTYEFMRHAQKDILITGLGIGMILIPLVLEQKYDSVTIVEKSQDVIDLVWSYVGNVGMNIVCADAFEWKPKDGEKFDTIWHDIWPTISEENLPEIEKLKRRYGQWLKKGGWQGAWAHEKIKELRKKFNDEMELARNYGCV